MDFVDEIKKTIDEEYSYSTTENGALGFSTSGKTLLDLNFSVTSLRSNTDEEIIKVFEKAYFEDKLLALKWLFFARDVRSGLGERRLFRVCINWIAKENKSVAKELVRLIPEYGRFDDLLCLLDTDIKDVVIDVVKKQIDKDYVNKLDNKPISLLAKWLPSENASSKETKRYAKIIMKSLKMNQKQYRKMLSSFREYLKIVERDMSAGNWSDIDYNTVPSRANLIYKDAFLKNDEERRREYLDKLSSGDNTVKINSDVLFPHDIIHKYSFNDVWEYKAKEFDIALEEMWKSLPNFVDGNDNTITVVDGSGSMYVSVGNTNITAWEVANALGIYFAERSTGEFANKFITFSSNPKLVNLSVAKTLREKINIAAMHTDCSNTNIEATFDLILNTAIRKHIPQSEMPSNVLILSDMEFDDATNCNWFYIKEQQNKTLFRTIQEKFESSGYKMPRCIFWNINGRTNTIPVNVHETFPVTLVSGFSPVIVKMVLSNNLDPLECLLEQVNSERYKPIEDAIINII